MGNQAKKFDEPKDAAMPIRICIFKKETFYWLGKDDIEVLKAASYFPYII